MTIRRRSAGAVSVDLDRFVYDDAVGPDPYFATPGYDDAATAERAWRLCRRDVWLRCHRGRIPRAAAKYDGLLASAHEFMWASASCTVFPLADALAAIRRDRDAVDAFRTRDPRAAAEIADVLDVWLADLASLEMVARAAVPFQFATRIWPDGRYGERLGRVSR